MSEARWPRIPAPFALPVGATLLLMVGAAAAGLHGRLSAVGVSVLCGVITGTLATAAEPMAAIPLSAVGWLTATGFSQRPYGALNPTSAHATSTGENACRTSKPR